MNKKQNEKIMQAKIDTYFNCARKQKCPPSMKKNLYQEISQHKQKSWYPAGFAMAGLSMVFVTAVVFNITKNTQQETKLAQAQAELQVAMHYINQVTLKSLSAVNNNGIKPGLIRPLARTYASL